MALTVKELYSRFNLLPVGTNKQPNHKILGKDGWAKYRTEKIPFELLQNTAVGIITGPENLEVIDIDNHFADAADMLLVLAANFNSTSSTIFFGYINPQKGQIG